MSILNEEQIKQILNEANKATALYGGGFKPPTKGHFEVVEKALKEYPEIDKLKIFVGSKERDGVSQEESILVWEVYTQHLPMKVEIIPSTKPPIQAIYNYAKENTKEDIYWIIGAREGNEEDFNDIEKRTSSLGKYQNLTLKPIVTTDGSVSGTNARLALKTRNQEEFNKFLPSQLDSKDKDEVFNILSPTEEIEETKKLNEGRYDTISNKISSDIFRYWKENIDQGLVTFENSYEHEGEDIDVEATIKLSPEIEYLNVDGGADDETDFITVGFEVNPDKLPGAWEEISFNLKDVIRHEIEHLTHGEGFMLKPGKYIEDDQLIRQMIDMELLPKSSYFKLEKEIDANLQGMYFRAKKEKRPFRDVIDAYLDTQDITSEEKSEIINLWSKRISALGLPSIQETLNENATYSNKIDYKQEIKELTKHMLQKGMNILPLPKVIFKHGDQENASQFLGKTAYYDPNTSTVVLYTEGRHPKDIVRSFSHEMIHHIQNLEGRLDTITTTNTQEDDNLNDIETEANLKGTMTFRNWTDSLNEIQTPAKEEDVNPKELKIGIEVEMEHTDSQAKARVIALQHLAEDPKYYTKLKSLGLEEKKEKDPFGLNQYARELAQGLEEDLKKTLIPEEEVVSSQDMDYVIYSDMDGVLTDFEKRFQKFSGGMLPSEYESKYGRNKFWDLIDNQIGVKFWVGMPWMEDGKQYWEYISKYNPILLSSPSINNESRLGKRLWVKKYLPGTPLKLAYAKNKKNYAKENAILIDDRKENINQWVEAGGIGILHTSASDTIKQLKDLGL